MFEKCGVKSLEMNRSWVFLVSTCLVCRCLIVYGVTSWYDVIILKWTVLETRTRFKGFFQLSIAYIDREIFLECILLFFV